MFPGYNVLAITSTARIYRSTVLLKRYCNTTPKRTHLHTIQRVHARVWCGVAILLERDCTHVLHYHPDQGHGFVSSRTQSITLTQLVGSSDCLGAWVRDRLDPFAHRRYRVNKRVGEHAYGSSSTSMTSGACLCTCSALG